MAPGGSTADEVLEHHTKTRSEVWRAHDDVGVDEAYADVRKLRQLSEAEAKCLGERLHFDECRALFKRFKSKTGTGIDGVSLQDMACGSVGSLSFLHELDKEAITARAWPLQTLLTLMLLIAKKGLGCRTIALAASFIRLVMAYLAYEVRNGTPRLPCRETRQ